MVDQVPCLPEEKYSNCLSIKVKRDVPHGLMLVTLRFISIVFWAFVPR